MRSREPAAFRNPCRALPLLAALLAPAMAQAQLVVNAGADYFRWTEDSTPDVKETGSMGFIGVAWTQDKETGTLFGYRGKIWGGSVDYKGATLSGGTPVDARTEYAGISNEVQVRYRKNGIVTSGMTGTSTTILGGSLDSVFGVGLDAWRRKLSSIQREDYYIGYARLGVESNANYKGQWTAGLGVKYPFWTYENAHLRELGFDANPPLHPGKELAPYASLGYRFSPAFQAVAYYEGFRFGRSDTAQVNEVAQGLGPTAIVQPASTMAVLGIRLEYLVR